MAALMGQPLQPWQRQVADIGLELVPDTETGELVPAYREIVITVPRQSGKTTLVLAWELQRALRWGNSQRIIYTAQTGWAARQKLLDDQVPLIENTQLASAVKRVFRGAGMEAVVFKTGSRLEIVPNTPTAMHGRVVDLCVIDEAFADTTDVREQAALPAMATRADGQLIVVSTAGTAASTYLKRKVQTGRAAVEAGTNRGIAYFEWSADPLDDPDDPATWWRCMPALGNLISEEVVAHARQTMGLDEFRRAWLNQWSTTSERLIEPHLWTKINDPKTLPDGQLSFAVDIALDRSCASIAVCDRAGNIELVEAADGVSWVAQRAQQLSRKYRAPVVVDGYGPAGTLLDPLEALGLEVIKCSTRQVTAAVGLFYDGIQAGAMKIRPHDKLDLAADGVKKKMLGTSWLWSRTGAEVDITPLYAVTLAWYHATQRNEKPKPRSTIF